MGDQPKEALYWQTEPDGSARCLLCPHRCRIASGHTGICRVRKNEDGRLIAWNYGKITSLALDPIEKKPLYHFHPGSRILSVGSFGCNFHCDFCQNWAIAQQEAPYRLMQPAELVLLAAQAARDGNIGLAYTYNEPLVGVEFVLDCSRLIRRQQQKNVLVTNGYINADPLEELLPWIDAANIDLKAWNEKFYNRICGGLLEPVKKTISSCAESCHLEVTTLLIPGLNDSEDEIEALAGFLASISPDIPWHLSRHHPDYRMKEPAPISRPRMEMLAELARRKLKNVWLGNI
jgi:pyruvate formate lyase activating enzyme